jgi:hypothetical protein
LLGGVQGITNLPMPVACCFDAAQSVCGMETTAGAMCEAPARSDARCPGLDLGAFGGVLGGSHMAGCCIDNACGLDGALLGRGCVENAEARTALAGIPLIGNLAKVPAPMACDRGNEADAGSEDAGR